jgi:hypothetical protein
MTVFGSKERFAILVGPQIESHRSVEVWAGGKTLTPFDTSVYLPSFVRALGSTELRLKEQLNFLKYESLFIGLTAEEAIQKVVTPESAEMEHALAELRFANWGPTTDDFLCFLLPIQGNLALICSECQSGSVHAVPLFPYEIIQVIEGARHALSSMSTGA